MLLASVRIQEGKLLPLRANQMVASIPTPESRPVLPFRRAPPGSRPPSCASSAVETVTSPLVAPIAPRRKVSKSFVPGSAANSPSSVENPTSASPGTSQLTFVAHDTIPPSTSAPFVGPNPITRTPASVSNWKRIVTPYLPDGYKFALTFFDLSARYPTLVRRLRNGFPIGNFSPLRQSWIHKNHNSARPVQQRIEKYILEEVGLGRMSGPFTPDELSREFDGEYFVSSPLGAVDKAGDPGEIRITRDLSYKGSAPHSVNDEVNPDEEPTRWDKATVMSEVVSRLIFTTCNAYRILLAFCRDILISRSSCWLARLDAPMPPVSSVAPSVLQFSARSALLCPTISQPVADSALSIR